MAYKYFVQDTGQLDGPGDKKLNVLLNKKSTTLEEIEKHLSAFMNDADVSEEEQKIGKKKFFEYLHNSGKTVTAGNKTFSCKKIND